MNKYEWRCRKKDVNEHDVCGSVRKNLLFSISKLSMYDILCVTKLWFGRCMNDFIVNELKVNKNTIVEWFMFCQEVCRNEIVTNSWRSKCCR